MHIMEGFLPWQWCLIWWLIAIPFLGLGTFQLRRLMRTDRHFLPLLGACGAFIFILSALKLPSVTGSSSHPTGTGLSTICFGVFTTSVIGAIVLLFQALLLAHGGISTLGANMVSMAIGGPLAGYGVYRLLRETRVSIFLTVFLVTAISDLATYTITSLQLALAYPAAAGGISASFSGFFLIFAITQIPLAVIEGCIFSLVFKYIALLKPDILIKLKVFSEEQIIRGIQWDQSLREEEQESGQNL